MSAAPSKKTGNRREFVRTRIPLVERIASIIILLLVVVAALAIHHAGTHFDPNLYAVRTDSLQSTVAAVAGKSETAPSDSAPAAVSTSTPDAATVSPPDTQSAMGDAAPAPAATTTASAEGAGEGTDATPAPAPKGDPLEINLAGIKPMGDTEFYNSDTLYEKIDGRSPAYQSFNVQGLRCRSFAITALAGSYVDVYEYRFDSPVDAFGMFSLERDPKGSPLTFAADGYSGEMGWFFRQGAVYVQIIASDEKPATLALGLAIAQNRAQELPTDDHGLAGRRKLPAAGLVTDSVSFVPENAQGQAALKEVFQAKYKFNGAEVPFFVMAAPPAETESAWQSFQKFCTRFGKTTPLPNVNDGKIFSAQVFGKWKVIYQRQGELGGVFDAADEATAQAFVEKYLRGEIK